MFRKCSNQGPSYVIKSSMSYRRSLEAVTDNKPAIHEIVCGLFDPQRPVMDN